MIRTIILSFSIIQIFLNILIGQPSDLLTPEFFKNRREAFRNLMPDSSAAFFFANPENYFASDRYHQNPDLYYLTGYNEPNAVLILFKEWQAQGDSLYNEIFFVRSRNPQMETWTGKRLGPEGVKHTLGILHSYPNKLFSSFPFIQSNITTILYDVIPDDMSNDHSGYDLYGLYETFKDKFHPDTGSPLLHHIKLSLMKNLSAERLPGFIQTLRYYSNRYPFFACDTTIQKVLSIKDTSQVEKIRRTINEPVSGYDLFDKITGALREIKTNEELSILKKSIDITALAHIEALKMIQPGIYENQIEAIHTFVHRKLGAQGEGFTPIVGSGSNACILHYDSNDKLVQNGDLVLMDIGAQFGGYSGDITRTVPANGAFTKEQKEIYEIVYQAQNEVFKLCNEGNSFQDIYEISDSTLALGLVSLGIIKDAEDGIRYTLHNCSHSLGLDVHDKESGDGLLKENMVITVEPGIYIPAGSPCDKKWWNIGIRIEDDVLIGKYNCEILSSRVPRSLKEIEKIMSQKSKLEKLNLTLRLQHIYKLANHDVTERLAALN